MAKMLLSPYKGVLSSQNKTSFELTVSIETETEEAYLNLIKLGSMEKIMNDEAHTPIEHSIHLTGRTSEKSAQHYNSDDNQIVDKPYNKEELRVIGN